VVERPPWLIPKVIVNPYIENEDAMNVIMSSTQKKLKANPRMVSSNCDMFMTKEGVYYD
jgi:hypothetical protein